MVLLVLARMLWDIVAKRPRRSSREGSPDASQKLRIVLRKALSGAEFDKFELAPTQLVEDLRRHLVQCQSVGTVTQVHLVHGKRLLHDGNTLRESGLADGATVDVVERRRRFVVTGSADGTAKLWDLEDGTCFLTLHGNAGGVLAAKRSPDCSLVMTCSEDGNVNVWRIATGACIFCARHSEPVWSASFSLDGCLLATGTDEGVVRIWKVHSGDCVLTIPLNEHAPVRAIDFSSDSKSVVTACGDTGASTVWNLSSGLCEVELEEPEEIVFSAGFAPDGRSIVTGCGDGIAQLCDVGSGLCTKQFQGHDGAVHSAAFSPNGRFVLTSSSDGTAKIWSSKSGECVRTFEGHDCDVFSAAFSDDSAFIGTASADNTARIWSTRGGHCVHTLEGHCAPVLSVEFGTW